MLERLRSRRAASFFTSLLLLALSGAGLRAAEVASYFSDAPPGSLIRSLSEVGGEADPQSSGLTVQRQLHWSAGTGVLLIKTSLVNETSQPIDVKDLTVIDWTFPVEGGYDAFHYAPLAHREDTWYGSTYWTGPDWTRVGKDWHHSGEQTASIRRFTAPRDGHLEVRGRVFKADTNGGDGVRLEIRVGRETRWTGELAADDHVGLEPALSLDVQRGDAIRFIVHRRGNIGFDTTRWDPLITYDDGTSFQASEGFSSRQQGEAGWFYEMESDTAANAARNHAAIHAFRPECLLLHEDIQGGRQLELGPADALPAWILADHTDSSGIVLALASETAGRLRCSQAENGSLRIQVLSAGDDNPPVLAPGSSLRLPDLLLAAYKGTWLGGSARMQQLLADESSGAAGATLRKLWREAADRANLSDPAQPLEFDLMAMVQHDWHQQDQLEDRGEAYLHCSLHHLDSAQALLDSLLNEHVLPQLAAAGEELRELQECAKRPARSLAEQRLLYVRARALKRRIALANPLMNFGSLLLCKRVPSSYSHLVMQYYGWRARPGGGIFVLDRPGFSLSCRDILAGQLADGNVLEPRLSFDGNSIVFSFVKCRADGNQWDPNVIDNGTDDGFYHIWAVNVDGTNLRQLTSGPYDDLMPCWLPDGGIAFSSTRRRGYARCFGGQFSRRWHVYTIHRMNGDGTDIRLLSAHDTNEWFPTVSHAGDILYSRWDYIDRDAVTHQNLWAMRPDGTNPVAVWGNATATPHCSFQIQPVPGSEKIVFTASAHHSITGGSLAMIDKSVNNNGEEAITRLTPAVPFPEAESMDIREYYASPWPLSEKYFLVAYSPTPLVWEPDANARNALGIYLLDAAGNRELIYRDPEIGCTNPCPLIPRPTPPVVSSMLPSDAPAEGEMVLTDVYQGLGDVPRGSIKQLRIIQIFPKTTPIGDFPRVGLAREENARAILGTVPIHPDGSARFRVPALKPLLFQALDEQGFAYQTMRTITYVQPGERVSCAGCHESRRATPANHAVLALQHPPSDIEPGAWGGRPFSFMEVVQPVLDQHCVRCHGPEKQDGEVDLQGTPRDGFTQSYWALCGDRDFWGPGTNPENAAAALVPRYGGRNQIQITPPGGHYGARGSRLMKLLSAPHYDVQLSSEEMRQLAAWIDCNAIFYGTYLPEEQARQLRGERLDMPEIQ